MPARAGLPHRAAARLAPLLLPGLALALALAFAGVAGQAGAQEITLDLGEGGSLAGRGIQLLVLVTVLSLVPGLAIMLTCFPFIVTVLAILRQGLGLQQSPPNMLIVSLALFLTYFVMDPVLTEAWREGVVPMMNETLAPEAALPRLLEPFRVFMAGRLDPETYESLSRLRAPEAALAPPLPEAPLSLLIPSFLLSEIARAFEIGFLLFLPFLIIDLVVAAVLMSMGMMMVPPALVSLPFKLAFFVIADGWTLISEALVRSYITPV